MDETKVWGPDGALWTHEVIVIVPKELKFKNVSMAYMTGSCNDKSNRKVDPYDDELKVIDQVAKHSHAVAILIH
jgi:PhoPQ-activated pathogenicity-related protein